MKTLFAFLWTAAILSFGSAQWSGFAAEESSTDFEVFQRNGFQLLTGVSANEARLETNGKGWDDGEKIYDVTCNGAPLLDSTCIGKTIVNVTTIKSEDHVVSYTRKCDGEFHNKTIASFTNMYNMDTVQLCKGKSFVMMKSMKKDAVTGEWEKAFFSKTCFSKYIIAMKQLPPTPGADHFEVATHCEVASHTVVTRQEEKEPPTLGNGADLEGATVTCNCEEANIDEPCEGRFKIVMKKTMKPPENKRQPYRQQRRRSRSAKRTAETKIEKAVETKTSVPPSTPTVSEPKTQPQPIITTAPKAQISTPPEASPFKAPEVQPVTPPETVPSAAPEMQPVSTPETHPVAAPEVQPVSTPEAEPVTAPEVVPSISIESVFSVPPEAEVFTLSEPEASLSSEEQPLVFPGAKKKFEMEKTWTFICDGNWIPFGSTFFECSGKKQEITESEFYHSSKNCTGMFGASMFYGDKGGYKMCNGKSDFKEIITVPALPPTTFVF